MVSVSKFVCFAAVCVFNSGGGLWWLERARSLEVACTRPLSWCLYFYMYFACFWSVKNYKKIQPGKNPGNRQEHPKNRREPPWNFFSTWITQRFKGFFLFRTSVSVKRPWRQERPLRLCLWALKLRGWRPQLKHLLKPLVCPKERKMSRMRLSQHWSHKKTLDKCAVFC